MPDTNIAITKADELNSIGAKLFGEGHLDAARLHFLGALHLKSEHPNALQNLGAVLRAAGHHEAAASVARRSIVASSNNPFCRSNLGVSQLALRQYDGAIATLKSVLDDIPHSGPSWHNYGLALYMVENYGEALVAFDKSLELDADNNQCRSDRALTLLALGRIQEGLEAYEVRWKMLHRNLIWETSIHEWQGESLVGKSILVHHEQGFGDSIMLVRFIHDLETLGCNITLAVPSELKRLFTQSFDNMRVVDITDPFIKDIPIFDYHTPLLSTIRWLGYTSPHEIRSDPYIIAHITEPLPAMQANMKIGICWASGNHAAHMLERRRIVPLTQFLPLTELSGVKLISLQKGDGSNDIERCGIEGIVFDCTRFLDDFAGTAEVISQLDLVISVDSAVAHLAGALGKPCLMLSPYTRCWRWWNDNGKPWYNDMAIFSQSEDGTWNKAMQDITRTVADLVK